MAQNYPVQNDNKRREEPRLEHLKLTDDDYLYKNELLRLKRQLEARHQKIIQEKAALEMFNHFKDTWFKTMMTKEPAHQETAHLVPPPTAVHPQHVYNVNQVSVNVNVVQEHIKKYLNHIERLQKEKEHFEGLVRSLMDYERTLLAGVPGKAPAGLFTGVPGGAPAGVFSGVSSGASAGVSTGVCAGGPGGVTTGGSPGVPAGVTTGAPEGISYKDESGTFIPAMDFRSLQVTSLPSVNAPSGFYCTNCTPKTTDQDSRISEESRDSYTQPYIPHTIPSRNDSYSAVVVNNHQERYYSPTSSIHTQTAQLQEMMCKGEQRNESIPSVMTTTTPAPTTTTTATTTCQCQNHQVQEIFKQPSMDRLTSLIFMNKQSEMFAGGKEEDFHQLVQKNFESLSMARTKSLADTECYDDRRLRGGVDPLKRTPPEVVQYLKKRLQELKNECAKYKLVAI